MKWESIYAYIHIHTYVCAYIHICIYTHTLSFLLPNVWILNVYPDNVYTHTRVCVCILSFLLLTV